MKSLTAASVRALVLLSREGGKGRGGREEREGGIEGGRGKEQGGREKGK